MLPKPHGGKLIERIASSREAEEILSKGYRELEISYERAQEAVNIARGLFSPLTGFMSKKELQSVLDTSRLSNGLPWTIPIVLDISDDERKDLLSEEGVILTNRGKKVAFLEINSIYTWNKEEFAEKVYRTRDKAHPGVARTYGLKEYFLAGDLLLLEGIEEPFPEYNLSPKETRVLFETKGWSKVVGFQTRNVPHIGHEYVQKTALTFVDGLFINPVIGKKKKGDFRDEVIIKAYRALMENYYPKSRVVLSILPMEMRYAGPREAIHHAIIRKNFGCTHFIVGRDHAGVGNYYGPYEAQEIFYQFPDLGIEPVFFRSFFFCKKCNSVANEKTCPHGEEMRVNFSGTKIRKLLQEGKRPPQDLMRPEVSEAILSFENPFVE